jgi:hypothetical protein
MSAKKRNSYQAGATSVALEILNAAVAKEPVVVAK